MIIKWKKAFIIAAGITAAPLAFSPSSGVAAASVCGAEQEVGGTCCSGFGYCYPNNCSDNDCRLANHWWRTDGEPCGNPI